MDFLFVSMPYARFISRWFAHMPNINLGILQALLTEKGKKVKTFHFHLEFLPYLRETAPPKWEKFLAQTELCGVEYMGLDYLFATLLFEDRYEHSKGFFKERLESIGLTIEGFEEMRGVVRAFTESVFSRISPYLGDTKLVGFSSSHYQLSSSLLLCSMIKKIAPGIRVVIGGKDCSGSFGPEMMRNMECVDFVGTGECENTVERLLQYMEDGNGDLHNVLYRDSNGEIRRSPAKPNMPINMLPFPMYDFEDFPLDLSEIILPVEFGRGCPWKRCTFCPDESYNILCQAKTAERLRQEFDHYQSISEDLRNFFILDSDTLKNPEVILEVSRDLRRRKLNFIYAEFRAERMNREVLSSLLDFGTWVSHFQIGIETFSERVLSLMNKGVTVLKNVEVLKASAELGIPVQFNLFTCFPGMTVIVMRENIRVMERIAHLLVYNNILIYPGEFYLPTDCPVFTDAQEFGLQKHDRSVFSSIFDDFPMPSYSNYPYPYFFDNDEEQYGISQTIRKKVEEIKSGKPSENFMIYRNPPEDESRIVLCRHGLTTVFPLSAGQDRIYLMAMKEVREVSFVSEHLNIPVEEVRAVLKDFDEKGLVLLSSDGDAFLSLATQESGVGPEHQ